MNLSRDPKEASALQRFLNTISDKEITSAMSQGKSTKQMLQEIKEAPIAEINKEGVGDNVREIEVPEERFHIL